MATVQENKEIIINGFNDMKQGIANLEVSKVSTEQLEPVAKAAYCDYPLWSSETQYKAGDMLYVQDIKRNKMVARVIQDHVSSTVENENNPRNWVNDWKRGLIQIIPTLDAESAQEMSVSQISGYTLDASVVNNKFETIWTFLGDWETLNEELKMSESETNNYTEIVNILDNRIKSLEQSLNGVSEKLDTLLNSI